MEVSVVKVERAPLTESDRRVITRSLDELAARDGRVTPESFLELATPETSPLHRYFEWDDSRAAREHRLHQARQIVRVVVWRAERTPVQREPIRVSVQPAARPAYLPPVGERRRVDGGTQAGTVERFADALDALVAQYRGTMELFEELRTLRELAAGAREKAGWEGRRCPRCDLLGHGPGSRFCLQENAEARLSRD